MHRSGTSSVAGTFAALGAAAPKTLMPPQADNQKGFFESLAIANFNDEILSSAGTVWHDWRKLNSGWYESTVAKEFERRAVSVLTEEFQDQPVWVMKDPRMCRMFPFWLSVMDGMGVATKVVIPIRPPLDVATSLKKRNGFSLSRAMLLWLRHVLDAERDSRGVDRSIIFWADFRRDWRKVCLRVSADINMTWPKMTDVSAHYIDEFLSDDLVHNKTEDEDFRAHSSVHSWTLEAYDALKDLSQGKDIERAQQKLDDINAKLDVAASLFGPVVAEIEAHRDHVAHEHAQSRSELHRVNGELEAAIARQTQEQHAREQLNAHIQELNERIHAYAEMVQAKNSELDALNATLAASWQERESVANERERLAHELERLAHELQTLTDNRAALEQHVADLQSLNDSTAYVLDQKVTALEALEAAHASLAERARTLESELAALIEANSALEDVVEDQKALNGDREREILDLHSRLETVQASNASTLAMLEQKTTALETRETDYNASIQERQILKDRLERQVHDLSGSLNALQAKYDEQSSQIAVLQNAAADFTIAKSIAARKRHGSASNLLNKISARFIARKLVQFGLFDCSFYVAQLREQGLSFDETLSSNSLAGCQHYMAFGWAFGINPNPYFDNRWYLTRYPDVQADGINPLWHYFAYGAAEGRDPGPLFSTDAYLRYHPDVAAQNANPLSHYLLYGQKEGRLVPAVANAS
ncbi:hypothetical protein [Rhizobium oryziradicis]|nr:hypothetical protein [Rhizobium oryziradicis]